MKTCAETGSLLLNGFPVRTTPFLSALIEHLYFIVALVQDPPLLCRTPSHCKEQVILFMTWCGHIYNWVPCNASFYRWNVLAHTQFQLPETMWSSESQCVWIHTRSVSHQVLQLCEQDWFSNHWKQQIMNTEGIETQNILGCVTFHNTVNKFNLHKTRMPHERASGMAPKNCQPHTRHG